MNEILEYGTMWCQPRVVFKACYTVTGHTSALCPIALHRRVKSHDLVYEFVNTQDQRPTHIYCGWTVLH